MNISTVIENFSFSGASHPDIAYLNSPDIGDIIVKGLTETYLTQPNNPIKFLGNWLLNEFKSNSIKTAQIKNNQIKEESTRKFNSIKQKQDEVKVQKEKEMIEKQEEKVKFIEQIVNCSDLEEILDSICEGSCNITQSTGVYIYNYDKKRVKVSELDDEFAHKAEPDLYSITHFSKNHSYLKGETLLVEEGVTNNIFAPVEEAQLNDQNPDNNELAEVKEEDKIPKHVFITEVVREPKIKFYKEPKLGCYFAIDLSYMSSINERSLESSIESLKEFHEEEKQIQEEKQAKLEELKDQVNNNVSKLADSQNEDLKDININKEPKLDEEGNPIISEVDNLISELESKKAILKEFEKRELRFVMAFDTLGQDRSYTEEEKAYIFKITKSIVKTRTEQEKSRLLQMRDIRIRNISEEKTWIEANPIDKIPEIEEVEFKKYITETFELGLDENQKEDEHYKFKLKFILQSQLTNDDVLNSLFLSFSKYEFVEHERIFQNILYFTGIEQRLINFPDCNKLNWKVARNHWNMSIIQNLIKYNPIGPKVENFSPLVKWNRLNKLMSEIEDEKVREYSYVLSRLLEAFKLSMFIIY